MGSPALAVPSLMALLQHDDLCRLVGVVTQPDRPAGRGKRLHPPPVKVAAREHDIPVYQPTSMKAPQTVAQLRQWAPQLIVVVAYGRILPAPILSLPPLGCVNVHASLLPRHRRAAPILHAILAGDAETGVCLMQMDAGLETAPVYACARHPIAAQDTAGTLADALAQLGASLLRDNLSALLAGALQASPQNPALATYAPPLHKEQGRLDFNETAAVLARRVRALTPWPGTFFEYAGRRIQVLAAHPQAAAAPAPPGRVVAADTAGVQVACGEGVLVLDQVKPAGKKAMPAGAWVAGRGIAPGAQL